MSTLATTNLKHPSSGSNNIVLASDGTTTIAAPSNIIKSGTAVASTSGTAIDFTGIPSWVKRITVMWSGVSTSGTSNYLIQLGTSSGVTTTGYSCVSTDILSTPASSSYTSGLGIRAASGANTVSGQIIISTIGSNVWTFLAVVSQTSGGPSQWASSGAVTLSGTLDRIRNTTVNGTDTFDAGTINILYEG